MLSNISTELSIFRISIRLENSLKEYADLRERYMYIERL